VQGLETKGVSVLGGEPHVLLDLVEVLLVQRAGQRDGDRVTDTGHAGERPGKRALDAADLVVGLGMRRVDRDGDASHGV
jgi:hypothetical protein